MANLTDLGVTCSYEMQDLSVRRHGELTKMTWSNSLRTTNISLVRFILYIQIVASRALRLLVGKSRPPGEHVSRMSGIMEDQANTALTDTYDESGWTKVVS